MIGFVFSITVRKVVTDYDRIYCETERTVQNQDEMKRLKLDHIRISTRLCLKTFLG